MADKPLFQNTDEQEAAYAPQTGSGDAARRALAEEGTLGENTDAGGDMGGGVTSLPGPGASGALNNMGDVSSAAGSPTVGRGDAADEDEA